MKTTNELEEMLLKGENICNHHLEAENIYNELNILINQHFTKAALIAKINGSTNDYKYLTGERSMNRDFLIKVCIVLNLELKHVNTMLKSFQLAPLYVKHKRDAIIMQGIINKFTLQDINTNLSKEKDCSLLI